MADVNSVIHEIIDSKKTVYIYSSKICDDFTKLEIAKYFCFEQIEKLVSLYLEKLTKKSLLIKSTYSKGTRYKKTDLFYKPHHILKVEKELHFSFILALDMQKALCDLEMTKCRATLVPYNLDVILGKTLETEIQLEYLIKKERVYFLQNKISTINTLLGLYKLNNYSFAQNN